jgi:hypothetical protein
MSEAPPVPAVPDVPGLPCVLCARPLADADAVLVNGKRTCKACRDAVLAELATESAGGHFARAIGAGLAAAAACGALWALIIVLTEREIGFAAVGVGWAVAHAMRLASGGRRGPRLQKAAVGCSLLGLLLGKFFFVAHALRDMTENAPNRPPNFHLSYFDPRMFRFFARVFPHMLTIYDALWLFLALSAAWRILKPARVVLSHAATPGNAAPAA